MSDFWVYLLKVNVVFAILYLVYWLMLSRLTFHGANRLVLLLMLPLSYLLPTLDVSFQADYLTNFSTPVFAELPEFAGSNAQLAEGENHVTDWFGIALWGYLLGVLLFLFRIAINAFKIFRLKQNSTAHQESDFRWISAKVPAVFSFFNWIFVPQHQTITPDSPIIEHEKTHAKKHHSIDLITTELLIAWIWFNPFVYLFRRTIRTVHECQVDALLLRGKLTQTDYLQMIRHNLSVGQQMHLQHNFSGLTLKKRIEMITKNKSKKTQVIRYVVLLPIVALMLLAFTKPYEKAVGVVPMDFESVPDKIFSEYIFPIEKSADYKITQQFGVKFKNPITKKMLTHRGLDIATQSGVAVLAIADGVVEQARMGKNYGNVVVINHGNGMGSLYAHMKDFKVKTGQKIKQGQIIGHVGSTGISTGPHLHFEMKKDKKHVDPFDYVKE